MKKYEVLWYVEGCDDPKTKEFSTKQAALNYYMKHRKDKGCYGWWVTKRDKDWYVVEDIVY